MNLLSDIRFAFRLLVKNPGSSAMAILVMAVGTGVAITMFAFVNGVLWSSLGLKEDREILSIQWTEGDRLRSSKQISPLDLEVFKRESKTFDKMTGFGWWSLALYNPASDAPAKTYTTANVEADFFEFARQKPYLGRTFTRADAALDRRDKIVVSYQVWEELYEGSEDIIGSLAILDGRTCEIVGVMPRGFLFPDEVHVWVAASWLNVREIGRSGFTKLFTMGILKEGVSVAEAKAELATIAERLAQAYPETNENLTSLELERYVTWYTSMGRNFSAGNPAFAATCYFLLFCSILVLAVACANVFNLVMTRVANRTAELSVRSALGAKRSNIVMQVLIDGLILITLGSAVGVLIAGWSLEFLWAKFSQQNMLPYWWHMNMDARVMGFVILLIVISAVASSLIPGLRASRASVSENLKDDSRTSSGLFLGALSKGILGFQIMVTGILAFVSVMMLIVWMHMKNRDLPYDPDTIYSAMVRLGGGERDLEKVRNIQIVARERIRAHLEKHPNIKAVAFSHQEGGAATPDAAGGFFSSRQFEVEGEVYETEDDRPESGFVVVTEDLEKVFDVEPLLGRGLTELDTHGSELVCLVNKSFVDAYWTKENPIGKRIRLMGVAGESEYRTVVGVLPNIMPAALPGENLREKGYFKIYLPYGQTVGFRRQFIIARAYGDRQKIEYAFKDALRAADPSLAIQGGVISVREILDRDMVSMDLLFAMFGVFGLSSLIMGIVGLYAIVSFTTRQRFREFGIRMALGADARQIVMTVVKRGILLLSMGGMLGIAIGHVILMRMSKSIDLHDLPFEYAYPIAIGILVLATCVSMGIPAWRASRISPIQALRVE